MAKKQESEQQLEARIAQLERILGRDTRFQEVSQERDVLRVKLVECRVLLQKAMANDADWRDKATNFFNSAPGI
ncbi:MAG: hypothetical protein ACO29P_05715 [Bacteroidia bacterium]|jgi:uncharacterized protein with PIN domain